MLARKRVTLGLFSTLMLLGLSCGGPQPSDDEANVQLIVMAASEAPKVIQLKFSVLPGGEDVVFDAESRINATGQAEVDITVTSGGIPKINVPQIVLSEADSGCIGCPENTLGTGTHTEMGMAPGFHEIILAIRYPGDAPNVSAAIDLTLDQEPGAEYGYIMPGRQAEGGSVTVVVKPTNPEGPLTDLELSAEFDGVSGSKVALPYCGGDDTYCNALTAPPVGFYDILITIVNTVTGGNTVITYPDYETF